MKIYLTPAERDILEHARILKDLYYPKGNPCMVKCNEYDRQVCCGYCAEAKRYQEEIVQPITKAGLYEVWREIQEMLNLQDEIRNKQKLLDKKRKRVQRKICGCTEISKFSHGLVSSG